MAGQQPIDEEAVMKVLLQHMSRERAERLVSLSNGIERYLNEKRESGEPIKDDMAPFVLLEEEDE